MNITLTNFKECSHSYPIKVTLKGSKQNYKVVTAKILQIN